MHSNRKPKVFQCIYRKRFQYSEYSNSFRSFVSFFLLRTAFSIHVFILFSSSAFNRADLIWYCRCTFVQLVSLSTLFEKNKTTYAWRTMSLFFSLQISLFNLCVAFCIIFLPLVRLFSLSSVVFFTVHLPSVCGLAKKKCDGRDWTTEMMANLINKQTNRLQIASCISNEMTMCK